MKKQTFKLLLTIICVLAAGICYSCSRQTDRAWDSRQVLEFSGEDASSETQSDRGWEYNDAADSQLETDGKPAVSFTDEAVCYVHVCGEVNNPGVYEMKPGSRVFQAVEQAGGFTETAAKGYLNLAREVEDGMKIAVPSQDQVDSNMQETSDGTDSLNANQGNKINLNNAAKEDLMTLKGIGQARADDIIKYRTEHGPFQSIEEIMNVPGIKNSAFEKIKDDITV